MNKISHLIVILVLLILLIPIIILGGVGPGIKIPGIISRFPLIVQDNKTSNKEIKNGDIIKVFIKSKNKIVQMSFEDYIVGVVAAEMPVKFDIEAIKAQAVAARTYAAAKMFFYGGKGCVRYKGADVCSEVHCQAWISKEERFKYWKPSEAIANWNKINGAVLATKGIVISYNNKLASGIKYFSTSDGKTENSIHAFGYAEPYLVSVDSPNEEESPSFKSQVIISKDEFINRIKKINSKINISSKKLASQVKILEWTEGGRVKNMKIGDKVFSGIDVRWAINLKSADFNIKIDKKNVTFNVKGYGHGVGMSQWGANEMGKRGAKYDEILKHYFKGTVMKKIDDIYKNKNI